MTHLMTNENCTALACNYQNILKQESTIQFLFFLSFISPQTLYIGFFWHRFEYPTNNKIHLTFVHLVTRWKKCFRALSMKMLHFLIAENIRTSMVICFQKANLLSKIFFHMYFCLKCTSF